MESTDFILVPIGPLIPGSLTDPMVRTRLYAVFLNSLGSDIYWMQNTV
jgi:hypothetical protein